MNKPIINGIDVSECVHLDEWKHCNICKELIKTIPDRHQCMTEQDLRCEYYSDCYFKQLKRLQEENEELKAEIDRQKEIIIYLKNYDMCHKTLIQYEKALEEIRKNILSKYSIDKNKEIIARPLEDLWCIKKIIDEVLNDRD